MDSLLRVRDLVTTFRTEAGDVRVVDRVSFEVPEGTTVALVGESGCGKSVTALSILRLLPAPAARIGEGSILFRGRELVTASEAEMRGVRGNEISMIFQEPMTSLNPIYSVGAQVIEAITLHQKKSRKKARARAIEMLRLVGIASPEMNIDAYPHHLSGGMRQRVMIAMALACEPSLLIADEPTTALDVTVQAQILDLISRLQKELKMSVLFITHDLAIVSEFARHVLVMYAGRVVESAPAKELFASPRHPYTKGLLESIPSQGARRPSERRRLVTIEGMVPDPGVPMPGCRFADRCSMAIAECRRAEPELARVADDRWSRCYRASELGS